MEGFFFYTFPKLTEINSTIMNKNKISALLFVLLFVVVGSVNAQPRPNEEQICVNEHCATYMYTGCDGWTMSIYCDGTWTYYDGVGPYSGTVCGELVFGDC